MTKLMIDEMCSEFLNYMYEHKNKGFSLNSAQYCNERTIHNLISISNFYRKNIIQKNPDKTFLNMGVGPGFLEWVCKKFEVNNLESVELKSELNKNRLTYEWFTNYLDVDDKITYRCNSIKQDTFKIFDCNKQFDYILCIRFSPIVSSKFGISQARESLHKFKPYAKKAIIPSTIYAHDVALHLRSIAEDIWNDEQIILNLENFNLYK